MTDANRLDVFVTRYLQYSRDFNPCCSSTRSHNSFGEGAGEYYLFISFFVLNCLVREVHIFRLNSSLGFALANLGF